MCSTALRPITGIPSKATLLRSTQTLMITGLFPSKLDTNFSKILQHGNWALVGPTDHRTLDRSAQEGYIRDLVYTLYEPRPSLPGVERVVLGHRFDCQWRGVEQHTLLMQAMSAWLSSVPMKMVCTHSANSPLLFHGLYLAAPTVTRHFHKYDIVPAVVPGALNSWISSPGTQHQRWIQRVAKEIERAQLLSRADNLPPLTKDTRIHLFGGGMGPSSGRFPESADLDRLVNTEEAGVIQIVKGERARLRAEEDQWNNLMNAEAKTAVQWAGTLSHKRWQDALCICCGWNSDEYLHESV